MQQNKKIKFVFIFLSLTFIWSNLVIDIYAQEIQKDVDVKIIISDQINYSSYTKFIRITNNQDIEGENDNLSILVKINISCISIDEKTDENYTDEILIRELINYEWNVTKTINSYSESGFGTLNIEENKSYILCAEVFSLNFIDTNRENNLVCKSINFPNKSQEKLEINNLSQNTSQITNQLNLSELNNLSESNESIQLVQNNTNMSEQNFEKCGCQLTIITNKDVFEEGEKIEFQINDCENTTKYSVPIEYWVEDKTKIVKAILNTTSKTTKSYTPSINVEEKYFLIKSRIIGCENISEKLIVFTKEYAQKKSFIQIYSPEEINVNSENEIIYFELEGYKFDSSKTLISAWLELDGIKKSEITKIYVENKNSNFHFKIPLVLDIEESNNYKIIVEGIDEREESKIRINYKSFDVEKRTVEVETNNINSSKIISFYARKKTFDENITFYISILNPENKKLILTGQKHSVVVNNLSEKNNINFSIVSEEEIILAELYEEEKLLDFLELKLNLTRTKTDYGNKNNESYTNIDGNNKENNSLNINELLKVHNFNFQNYSNELNNSSIKNKDNKITAKVIAVERNQTNIIFMIVAIIIGLILFNKKIRVFLYNKKTKIFK